MGYKWIGAILIIASCSGCGFAVAAGKRLEEKLLFQLLEILQTMESDLRYRLTPLPELCRQAAGETKGILHVVFLNLYRELKWQKLPDAGSFHLQFPQACIQTQQSEQFHCDHFSFSFFRVRSVGTPLASQPRA